MNRRKEICQGCEYGHFFLHFSAGELRKCDQCHPARRRWFPGGLEKTEVPKACARWLEYVVLTQESEGQKT